MKGFRLYKEERLCGLTTIDRLFSPQGKASGLTHSVMAYPWRAVWMVNPHREGRPARFLISVPKKRARHAVDRVLMRRRCREAYRLNRSLFPAEDCGVDIGFVYVGTTLADYRQTEHSMKKMLTRIASQLNPAADTAGNEQSSISTTDETNR